MEELNKNINENDAMQLPLVSICSITYNHAPYIRQCLDGFLMQNTKFKYEIIIHDDASTDGTAEIIKEYVEKYPNLITPIFQKENQYSKGVRGFYVRFVYPRAKGKYIALCDGDDYWTDPLKLQKQVDFLEANPEYVICSHRYQVYNQQMREFKEVLPQVDSNYTFDIYYYISYKKWMTQPLTVLFLRNALDLDVYKRNLFNKDASLFFQILKNGRGYLLSDTMGVYRHQESGIWSSAKRQDKIFADLQTLKGIYDAEKTILSAQYLYNFLHGTRYLGIKFLSRHCKLYIKSVKIILCELGFIKGVYSIFNNCIYRK